ncbi:hypothetical protein D1641_12035 [Colidextribacter sp. OB.20]|uniref:hypothetical protein n=1 Tax=Colidextribacter sp. OB.20 TaxID=2304568 RepID=UPI001370C04B|nr:hypothetical protein [Colidextribacter sp. OB.20]NBI10735.1 hypothetical protein [Colidextribacter sp. OB.20]
MEPQYITAERFVLTDEEKKKFEEDYELTSDAQKTYVEIILGIMQKMGIDEEEATSLTCLNKKVFTNLKREEKVNSKVDKRIIISIAVGFRLNVHMAEYILESCGQRFNTNDRLDMAYIYLLEKCKGKTIEECNGVLRDLGIEGRYMLGELSYKRT